MTVKPNSQVFLILTNKPLEPIVSFYKQIQSSTAAFGETCLLFHNKENNVPRKIAATNYYSFTNDVLTTLNYTPIDKTLVPGSNHFPLLKFYLQYPHYDYYWYIEDDVRFSGDWAYFFQFFTALQLQPDLITCHVSRYDEATPWYWWDTLSHATEQIPLDARIRSFNPIYRISNAALHAIHTLLTDRWRGHHEVLLPTLLYHHGFSISDFGGEGEFVLPGNENKFYIKDEIVATTGEYTMRFRPYVTEINQSNKLYHPVKVF